ncbi:MAG TPA: hypothetical protein PLG94_18295 [Smithellaceae bacterium]|nr:hypothetical protein [Smithellaceae bacterium]
MSLLDVQGSDLLAGFLCQPFGVSFEEMILSIFYYSGIAWILAV